MTLRTRMSAHAVLEKWASACRSWVVPLILAAAPPLRATARIEFPAPGI